jgi:hypothetical protein
MKQTAVEWLLNQFDEVYHIKQKFLPEDWEFLEERAKAMEKEQMTDAYVTGQYDLADKKFKPQEYYNETYNK